MQGLKEKEFESRIRRLLDQSGSSVNVVFEDSFPGRRLVGGKYHPPSHTITLYRDSIREQCLQIFGTDCYAEVYAAVIFAHELGHAEDRQLTELSARLDKKDLAGNDRKCIALKIEQNAWDFASKLLSDWEYAIILQEIVYQSLEPYYKQLMPHYKAAAKHKKQPASA